MRFWDSSAVVPLVLEEPGTLRARALLAADGDLVTWWGTALECASAIYRKQREGVLAADAVAASLDRLRVMQAQWTEVQPAREVRDLAWRVLRDHPLRAADAMQLAAALIIRQQFGSLHLVSFDDRLCETAGSEGFVVERR